MDEKRDLKIDMLMMLAIGPEAAVPLIERRGQTELTQSTKLPNKGSNDPESLESPIKWGPRPTGDALFRDATLPEGWTKKGSDHPMWSYVRDEKGRTRAEVFYKADFWDRDAFIRFSRRFYASSRYNDDGSITYFVMDKGQGDKEEAIYAETPKLPDRETDVVARYKAEDEARKRAADWLAERYPDHQNPNAYWDS